MIRIQHILKEFFRNVYRNPGTSFSGFLSMALLFVLFDLFWIAAGTSERFYSDLISDLKMEVFVSESAVDSTLSTTRQRIEAVPGVSAVEYVSKEAAREQLAGLVGVDLLVGYDSINPLPRSYLLSFDREYLTLERLTEAENRIVAIEGVSNVYYSKNWMEKAEKTRGIILNIGMILGAVVLLTVLISTANNMRLMTRARAVGFHQMRLQGAGGLFLALPFLMEGFAIAGLSAAAGWLAILYWKDKIDFTQFVVVFPAGDQVTLFCLTAAALGMISAYLGIRKLLRL